MIEVAKSRLAEEDQIVKSYRALHNGREGFLVVSKRQLMFLAETGMFRKTYRIRSEIPFDTIIAITVLASHRLAITDKHKETHAFTTFGDVSATVIKETLNDVVTPKNE